MRQMANHEMKNLSPVHSDPPSRGPVPEFIVLASSWQAVRPPGTSRLKDAAAVRRRRQGENEKTQYHQPIRAMKSAAYCPAPTAFLRAVALGLKRNKARKATVSRSLTLPDSGRLTMGACVQIAVMAHAPPRFAAGTKAPAAR